MPLKGKVQAIAVFLALGTIRLPAQRYPALRQFLLNQDVVILAKAGYDEQSIINTLLARPNRFDTSAAALAALAAEGISEHVLHAMLLAKSTVSSSLTALPQSPLGKISPDRAAAPAVQELPWAAKDLPYSASIDTRTDGRCPSGNISLSLAAGTLPPGLHLTAMGLDGTPQKIGLYKFTIQAAGGCSAVSRLFELAVAGRPILEATPGAITFFCRTAAQTPAPKLILVSSTWPNLPYRVETRDASWIRAAQQTGVTPEPGSAINGDVVTLTVNPNQLKPGTYRGSVVLWTQHGANAPVIPVVLIVGDNN
jgi:hypothetical protein